MAKSKLISLMSHDLPNISSQKRLLYRTDEKEVRRLFSLINREVFGGILPTPKIEVSSNCKMYWGFCSAEDYPYKSGSNCTIKLSDKWYCKQWLISTLAHEMCHQYQWDIVGKKRIQRGLKPIMSHGPSFFVFREKLKKHGVSLKKSHGTRKWFVVQNMFKC